MLGWLNTVVYYPQFYPTAHWLRVACLCWDRVYSLRTEGSPEPPPEVGELDDALGGVLEMTNVEDVARDPELQVAFGQWLDSRAEQLRSEPKSQVEADVFGLHRGKLANPEVWTALGRHDLVQREVVTVEEKVARWEKAEVERRHLYPTESMARPPPRPRPGSRRARYERLLEESWELRGGGDDAAAAAVKEKADTLLGRNLVMARWQEEIIYLPRDVALHYLSLCAAFVSRNERRDLAAVEERFTDAALESAGVVRADVMTQVLEAYLPEDLDRIEPSRLADLRQQLADKRHDFEVDVHELVERYANARSQGEMSGLDDELVRRARASVERTKRIYGRAHIETASQALGVSLAPPALASFLASALGIGVLAPVGVAAAIGLAAARLWHGYRQAEAERESTGWSYVLELQHATG